MSYNGFFAGCKASVLEKMSATHPTHVSSRQTSYIGTARIDGIASPCRVGALGFLLPDEVSRPGRPVRDPAGGCIFIVSDTTPKYIIKIIHVFVRFRSYRLNNSTQNAVLVGWL
jgi:hypothetical protein